MAHTAGDSQEEEATKNKPRRRTGGLGKRSHTRAHDAFPSVHFNEQGMQWTSSRSMQTKEGPLHVVSSTYTEAGQLWQPAADHILHLPHTTVPLHSRSSKSWQPQPSGTHCRRSCTEPSHLHTRSHTCDSSSNAHTAPRDAAAETRFASCLFSHLGFTPPTPFFHTYSAPRAQQGWHTTGTPQKEKCRAGRAPHPLRPD